MADAPLSIDAFNDLAVSAGPVREAAPVPEPEVPPLPAVAEPVAPVAPEPEPAPDLNPQRVIDDFLAHEEGAARNKSFAEKRRAADVELAQRQSDIRRIAAAYDGAEQIAQFLAANPDRLEEVQRTLYGTQPPAPAYSPAPQPFAAPPFAAPVASPSADPRVEALQTRVEEQERRLMNGNLHAATAIVQGRHHLTQGDMANVLQTAVSRGWFRPGMLQGEVEQVLEDARTIAFSGRERTNGAKDMLEKQAAAQRAVTAGGAATAGARPAYDARGKSLAEVRADALKAGARGL